MSSAALKAELAAKQNELIIVKEQLDRLIVARDQLVSTEDEIDGVRNEVRKQATQDGIWVGSNYRDYNTYTEDTFVGTDYRIYLDGLYGSIETVRFKISDLQDKIITLEREIVSLHFKIAAAEAAEAFAAFAAALSGRR